ncbi:MAG TPA: metallophosphoesterase family protein [Kofleriaceae bacterium]|nr:metallophosphoesterase family protein [Kofleriaceae bacterium]
MSTRWGLVGDIHAEDERLAAALAVFDGEGVERVLFVGDVVDGVGDVDRCCALLAAAGALGVRGNHDRWLLADDMRQLPRAHTRAELAPQSLAFLEALPAVRELAMPFGLVLLCHGIGEHDMRRLNPDDDGYALEVNDALTELVEARRHALVIGGHTHLRMVRRFGDLVFVNPGTLARDATPCCAVLDLDAGNVQFYELDDPAAPARSEQLAFTTRPAPAA